MAVSFIGGGNRSTRRKPSTCRKSLTLTYCCIDNISPGTGFELTTLVVIVSDCTDSCNSNYHTITTTTSPEMLVLVPYNKCMNMIIIYNTLTLELKRYHQLKSETVIDIETLNRATFQNLMLHVWYD